MIPARRLNAALARLVRWISDGGASFLTRNKTAPLLFRAA